MAEDPRAGTPLTPEEVARRGFGTSFRGFDQHEVRSFLSRVASALADADARLAGLHEELAAAHLQLANPPKLDEAALTNALGEETGRILRSAKEAATDIRQKAEDNAQRILHEAHEQADRLRSDADAILARRTAEAEAEVARLLQAARAQADALVNEAEAHRGEVLAEVERARDEILGDLNRRRRNGLQQLESLRTGRDRLLAAYDVVRRTLEDATTELARVDPETRQVAEAARAESVSSAAEASSRRPGPAGVDGEPVVAAPPVPAPPLSANALVDSPAVHTSDVESVSGPAPASAPPTVPAVPGVAEAAAPQPVADPAEVPRVSSVRVLRPEDKDGSAAGFGHDGEGVRIIGPTPRVEQASARQESGAKAALSGATADNESPAATPPRREALPAPPPAPRTAASRATPSSSPPAPVPDGGEPSVRPTSAASRPTPSAPPPASDPDPAPEPASDPEPTAVASGVAESGSPDELFARMRANRADAVARAEAVLAQHEADHVVPVLATAPEAEAMTEEFIGETRSDEDERLLQRRDAVVSEIETRLARRLKRTLQNEQNDVLDRLRMQARRSAPPPTPDEAEQLDRYRTAGAALLAEAADGGARFADAAIASGAVVDDLAAELAAAIVGPLRRRLVEAVSANVEDHADLVSAAYREWKTQRIERVAADHVAAAFTRGAYAAIREGVPMRWIVDDEGGACPDCDDNALAGPTPKGEAYPTGQRHPPAHAGCRCLVVKVP